MTPAQALELIESIPLGKRERAILNALARRLGKFIDRERLIDVVYGDDRGGGPLDAASCLSVTVAHLRKKLTGTGLSIQGHPYSGRRLMAQEGLSAWATGPHSRTKESQPSRRKAEHAQTA